MLRNDVSKQEKRLKKDYLLDRLLIGEISEIQKRLRKEIEIVGSRNCTDEFPEVIAYLEAGKFPVQEVISKVVSLDDAGDALAGWAKDAKGITKIMVDFNL
jgi:threonine dehydrogenase-like Zn-dependent dehydrogenase